MSFGSARRSTVPSEIIDNLPDWLRGVAYRAEDDTIALRAMVDGRELVLEASPSSTSALRLALDLCLDAANRAARMIEIPTDD